MVKIEYANISFDDLRGDLLADFLSLVFTSMSSDQEGIVTLAREASDWRIFSSFSPEASTRALSRGEVQQCAGRFIADVRRDLAARHLDANSILGGPHP